MSVMREMVSGVFWGMAQKYSGIVVQLAITAVLARLLSPDDFGVIAIAMVLINFFGMFADMGIGPAIIQNRNLAVGDLDSIFSFTVGLGILLSILFFAMAHPIASYFQRESIASICRILSVNLLFASCNIVPNALIIKNKRFKFIAERTLALQLICGAVSIAAAYHGARFYALLIAPIFTAVGVFILNYRQYPLRLKLRIDVDPLRKIFTYSAYQFLFNLINYFSRNLDKLIIGRSFTMTELGYYEKSYRLMMFPMSNITHIITPVMHPILTSFQNDYKQLAEKYNKIVKLLATISFPLGVFCYFAASDMIYMVYGDRWDAAVPVFKILALSLPLQMILSTTGSIYQSSGNTKWMFYGGVSNSFCTVTGFILAATLFHTQEAMAWAWTITLTSNFFVSYIILYKVVLHQHLWNMIPLCVKPLTTSILLFIALAYFTCRYKEISHILSFTFIALISGVAVLSLCYFEYGNAIRRKINSYK